MFPFPGMHVPSRIAARYAQTGELGLQIVRCLQQPMQTRCPKAHKLAKLCQATIPLSSDNSDSGQFLGRKTFT